MATRRYNKEAMNRAFDLENAVGRWITSSRLLEGVNGLLLAVSGGADSVALGVVLHRLAAAGQVKGRLVVGHVNHSLRGEESDADAEFVRQLAEQLGLGFVSRRVDVLGYAQRHKLSIETAARCLRLGALSAMARQAECEAVATGHQADDQAETLVHRLLRGTALRGLCGIRPMTILYGRRFARPLLTVRREDIEAYLSHRNLAWRDDATNRSCAFTRNRIRHRLLPELLKGTPDGVDLLLRLAEQSRQAQQRVETKANLLSPIAKGEHQLTYDRESFDRQSPWVQAEVISRAICTLGGGLRDVTCRHYQELMARAGRSESAKMTWPGGVSAEVEAKTLMFSKSAEKVALFPAEPVAVPAGKVVTFGPYEIQTCYIDFMDKTFSDFLHTKAIGTEWLDAERIEGSLMARSIRPGDRFWPLGLGGEKKVARFLQDSQIDKANRTRVFVLTDAAKILYLAPLRLDERAKVSGRTKKVLQVAVSCPAIKVFEGVNTQP